MSTSTTGDIDDAVSGLNRFHNASKRRRLIDRLSHERGQSWVFGADAGIARSSRGAKGPRRLSMRADSAGRNEDHDYHHPSPSKLPPGLGHGVSSSGTEAENRVEP